MRYAGRIFMWFIGTLMYAWPLANYWSSMQLFSELGLSPGWDFYAKVHTSLLRDVVITTFFFTFMLTQEERSRLGRVGPMATVWRAATIIGLLCMAVYVAVDIIYLRAQEGDISRISQTFFRQWVWNIGLFVIGGIGYHSFLRGKEWKRCPHCAERIRTEATLCRFCGNSVNP